MSFLLTTTDITSLAMLSLCTASFPLISTFPFIFLLALKGFLLIYTGLLPRLYFNLDLHNLLCSSIFILMCLVHPS